MGISFSTCQKATARILTSENEVRGAGFLVSSWYVLTCAHVIIDVLQIDPVEITCLPSQQLLIDFPSNKDKISRIGKIIIWQPCPTFFETNLELAKFGEDIALIELNKRISSSQIQPLDLVVFDLDTFEEQPEFSIYGFPTGSDRGKRTDGKILNVQGTRWLQLQAQENRPLILGGYSGSPLFAKTSEGDGIVGMTVASEYYYSDKQEQIIGGKEAYAIPALALAEIWFKQGLLIECLAICDRKWIDRAYCYCRENNWNPAHTQKVAEYVKVLYQYSHETEDKNYLLDFVVYLVVKADISEVLKGKLREWAKKSDQVTDSDFAGKCDLLKELFKKKQLSNQNTIDSRLWIIINEAGADNQYKIESVIYIKDINNYARDNPKTYKIIDNIVSNTTINRTQLQTPNYIFPALQEIVERFPDHNSLRIEFFLPFKSLDLAPDSWLIEDEYDDEPYPLGTQYPVSIRILERLGYKKKYKYASIWQNKWQPKYIEQLSKSSLVCCELTLDDIGRHLRQENILGIRCISPIETHEKKPKVTIMREGIPIALWFRQKLYSCCGQEKYQHILNTCLTNLTLELCDTRKAEPKNKNHLARHISFMWDEPTKLPFDAPTFSDRKI